MNARDYNTMFGLGTADPAFGFSVTRNDKNGNPLWKPVCSDTGPRACEILYKGAVYLGHIASRRDVHIFMPNHICPQSVDPAMCSYRPIPKGVSYTIAGA